MMRVVRKRLNPGIEDESDRYRGSAHRPQLKWFKGNLMAIKHQGATNGKIHPARVRLPSVGAADVLRPSGAASLSTRSLNIKLAKRVRALAHRERTSQNAIIECALWLFFQKGQDAKVMSLMDQAGIEPRRRRA
jgi:hypothetical protein